mgnify:CR=1 FL=1
MSKLPKAIFLIAVLAILITTVSGLYFFNSQHAAVLPTATTINPPVALINDAAAIERGRGLTRECMICHTMDEGGPARLGPNLFSIVGSHHAQMKGYAYSKSLAAMTDKIWTAEALDEWLKSPTAYAPGTKMAFPGFIDAQQRSDIIAYLRTLKSD